MENSIYENLITKVDQKNGIFWAFMKQKNEACFTNALLHEIAQMHTDFVERFSPSIKYFVFGSKTPGIYNFGGDLSFFLKSLEEKNEEAIAEYGYKAINSIHFQSVSFNKPVITVALVQGDALGGGFECALSLDVIIAEKGSKFGFPESLFNLFPGMGGYSFLARKAGIQTAEKLIRSGATYSAEFLHELGIIDVLTEDGQGEEATIQYIKENSKKWNSHYSTLQARKKIWPVSMGELYEVISIWIEALSSSRLSLGDLQKMRRLAHRQEKRMKKINNSTEDNEKDQNNEQ
jgi:DSF synthase